MMGLAGSKKVQLLPRGSRAKITPAEISSSPVGTRSELSQVLVTGSTSSPRYSLQRPRSRAHPGAREDEPRTRLEA